MASLQSPEGKRFVDSRSINVDDDLRPALTDWEATGRRMAYEED